MSFSGISPSRLIRRIAGIILALTALIVLPGCWVSSIKPLYDEGSILDSHKDPDEVFDRSLVGTWTATDDNCTTLMTITDKDQVYDLQSAEQGERCSDSKFHRQGVLVKLDTYYFLDVSPITGDVCDMCVAKHEIFLAKFDKATLALTPIDSDWLRKALEAKTVTLTTLDGDTDTVTASSRDLKAFCREFAENTEAFKPESAEAFDRK
jgi:hypothetical protein